MTQDNEHLNLLAIFHFIVGGITALFSCIPLLHVAMGVAMLFGLFDEGSAEPVPVAFAWLFIVFPAIFILCGWILAAFIITAGRKLNKRKSRTFCLIIAGLECLLIPFGTILGVFTITVLMRESVINTFETGSQIQTTD